MAAPPTRSAECVELSPAARVPERGPPPCRDCVCMVCTRVVWTVCVRARVRMWCGLWTVCTCVCGTGCVCARVRVVCVRNQASFQAFAQGRVSGTADWCDYGVAERPLPS